MPTNPSAVGAVTSPPTYIEKRARAWQKVIALILQLGYDSVPKLQALFPAVKKSTLDYCFLKPQKRGPQARVIGLMLESTDLPPEIEAAINEYFLLCPLSASFDARPVGHPGLARCRQPCIEKSSVIDVRQRNDGTIRRRRRCDQCDFKWTTYEISGYFRQKRKKHSVLEAAE